MMFKIKWELFLQYDIHCHLKICFRVCKLPNSLHVKCWRGFVQKNTPIWKFKVLICNYKALLFHFYTFHKHIKFLITFILSNVFAYWAHTGQVKENFERFPHLSTAMLTTFKNTQSKPFKYLHIVGMNKDFRWMGLRVPLKGII
jgi:hypothetical protein